MAARWLRDDFQRFRLTYLPHSPFHQRHPSSPTRFSFPAHHLFDQMLQRHSPLLPLSPLLHHLATTLASTTILPRRCSSSSSSAPPTVGEKKPKVVVISGPTGSGKSKLALEVAKRLGGEIISADSVQVYRGLDVGTAKPSLADRSDVRHHMIDILHPEQNYSAGQFYEDARRATRAVLDDGRVPVVAGGTGLYLRWYIYGKPDVPVSSTAAASQAWSELSHLREVGNWDAAVELVAEAGDPRSRSLPCNNWYRLQRSLEIIRSSGSPPSAFAVPYDELPSSSYAATTGDHLLDFDFLCFFLCPPRVDLYRSIDLRCEEMLMHGLLAEAAWLLDLGLLPGTSSATRAIGYRQAMEYLMGPPCRKVGWRRVGSPEQRFFEFLSEFQTASRNFAKRQMTWFRNDLIYRWIDASRPHEEVVEFVCKSYREDDGGRGVRTEFPAPTTKTESGGGEEKREMSKLKTYSTINRLFVKHEHCKHLLDWVSKNPRGRGVA